jgi:hypothetical protein
MRRSRKTGSRSHLFSATISVRTSKRFFYTMFGKKELTRLFLTTTVYFLTACATTDFKETPSATPISPSESALLFVVSFAPEGVTDKLFGCTLFIQEISTKKAQRVHIKQGVNVFYGKTIPGTYLFSQIRCGGYEPAFLGDNIQKKLFAVASGTNAYLGRLDVSSYLQFRSQTFESQWSENREDKTLQEFLTQLPETNHKIIVIPSQTYRFQTKNLDLIACEKPLALFWKVSNIFIENAEADSTSLCLECSPKFTYKQD